MSTLFMARKPDFKVAALRKDTNLKGNIGAAWKNEDGSISIVLNNFVQLVGDDNLLISLFPNDPSYYKKKINEKLAEEYADSEK